MTDRLQKIQIFGQRCSGTTYLEKLVLSNFQNIDIVNYYGFKHAWNAKLTRPIRVEDRISIIIIVRNPYDWIRSVHREPHHCPHLLGISMNKFLKTPWVAHHSSNWNDYNRKVRLQPITTEKFIESFESVISCRNEKMRLFETILKENNNAIVVKYEDLRDKTRETLNYIGSSLHLIQSKTFTQISTYKNSEAHYKKKKYTRLSNSDLNYLNAQLSWEIEEKFNYAKKDKVTGTLIDYFRVDFLLRQFYHEHKWR